MSSALAIARSPRLVTRVLGRLGGTSSSLSNADTLANPAAVRAALSALGQGAVGGGCLFRFDGELPLWVRFAFYLRLSSGRGS